MTLAEEKTKFCKVFNLCGALGDAFRKTKRFQNETFLVCFVCVSWLLLYFRDGQRIGSCPLLFGADTGNRVGSALKLFRNRFRTADVSNRVLNGFRTVPKRECTKKDRTHVNGQP